MEYYINTNGELIHWGIKGMRWGVRRYQNKDGSLTAAGKKRRAKLEGELEKLGGGKKTESEDAPKKKSVSEMSNKELQEHTTRMQLEKNYHDAQKQLAASMPQKQVSKGQKMVEKFLNEAIIPAATNAGKAYLEKMMKDKLGVKEPEDSLAALKKTFDTLDYQQKIDKIKNPDKYMNYDERKKKREYDDETARREAVEKEKAKDNSAESKTDKSKDDSNSGGAPKKTGDGEKQEKKSESKVYEGTVEGTGTSRKNNDEPKWSSKKETVIDAEWTEVNTSDIPTSMTTRGQSYITALLEPPKERDDD